MRRLRCARPSDAFAGTLAYLLGSVLLSARKPSKNSNELLQILNVYFNTEIAVNKPIAFIG